MERNDGTERLWHELAEAVPDLLLVVDRDGTILYLNRVFRQTSREALLGSRWQGLVSYAVQKELTQALDAVFAGGPPTVHEFPATVDSGESRWFAAHIGPIHRNGRVAAATIVARDVTDRHLAEAALLESEERYRLAFEHAPEAIVVLDADTECFVDVNRCACELFGMSHAELITSNPVSLSPPVQPDGRPTFAAAWERLREALEGGAPVFEWMHRTKNGTDLRCVVRLVRLPGAGRRLVRGSITDITRQRLLEEHVRQWQKLEAVGQLAGGIAHDFNNILTAIFTSADILAESLPATEEARSEIETLRQVARRGAALTGQLLRFARQRGPELRTLDLNEVVTDALGWLRRLVGRDIVLVERLTPSGAPVRADRNQIEQVLLNLVVNARDAMPSGGTLTVSTERLSDWHPLHGVECALRGAVVRLRVQDTGMGMDHETRGRIFEPFFSTKSSGKGTGLGLPIVADIVKQAGGCIEVVSQVGTGTSIDILLAGGDATSPQTDVTPPREHDAKIA